MPRFVPDLQVRARDPLGELPMRTPHGRFLAMLASGHHHSWDAGQPPGGQVTRQHIAVTGEVPSPPHTLSDEPAVCIHAQGTLLLAIHVYSPPRPVCLCLPQPSAYGAQGDP